MFRLIIVLLHCVIGLSIARGDTRTVPIIYADSLILLDSVSGEIVVIKATVDPIFTSSQVHFFFRRADSLNSICDQIQAQDDAGPFLPRSAQLADVAELTLKLSPGKMRAKFVAFELDFAWSPGGGHFGWLTMLKSERYRFARTSSLDSKALQADGFFSSQEDYEKLTRNLVEFKLPVIPEPPN